MGRAFERQGWPGPRPRRGVLSGATQIAFQDCAYNTALRPVVSPPRLSFGEASLERLREGGRL